MTRHVLTLSVFAAALIVGFWLVRGNEERSAYDQFLSNHSLVSAKRYLDAYPQGKYKGEIYQLLQEWCKRHAAECTGAVKKVFSEHHEAYRIIVKSNIDVLSNG